MALKGFNVLGGVIDESYTKPIGVIMSISGFLPFKSVRRGQRVAQIAFIPLFNGYTHIINSNLLTQSERGGFGSTG